MTAVGGDGSNAAGPLSATAGTGWSETYMGGGEEAERALFDKVMPRVEQIQDAVAKKQASELRRAFHNKGTVVRVRFDVAPALPEVLQVEYRDERREWEAALPALRELRDERGWRYLADATGLSERALRYALNEGKRPQREARARLMAVARGESRDANRASITSSSLPQAGLQLARFGRPSPPRSRERPRWWNALSSAGRS